MARKSKNRNKTKREDNVKSTSYIGPLTRSKSQARDITGNKSSASLKNYYSNSSLNNNEELSLANVSCTSKGTSKSKSTLKKKSNASKLSKTNSRKSRKSTISNKSSDSKNKSRKSSRSSTTSKTLSTSSKSSKSSKVSSSSKKSSISSCDECQSIPRSYSNMKPKQQRKSTSTKSCKSVKRTSQQTVSKRNKENKSSSSIRSRKSSNNSQSTSNCISKSLKRKSPCKINRMSIYDRKNNKKRFSKKKIECPSATSRSCSKESKASSNSRKSKCSSGSKTSAVSSFSTKCSKSSPASKRKKSTLKSCLKKRKHSSMSEESKASCKTKIERWNRKYSHKKKDNTSARKLSGNDYCRKDYSRSKKNNYSSSIDDSCSNSSSYDYKYNKVRCSRNTRQKYKSQNYGSSRKYSRGKYRSSSYDSNCYGSKRKQHGYSDGMDRCNDRKSKPRQRRIKSNYAEISKRFKSGKSCCCNKKDCCLRNMSMFQCSSDQDEYSDIDNYKSMRRNTSRGRPSSKKTSTRYPTNDFNDCYSPANMRRQSSKKSKRDIESKCRSAYSSSALKPCPKRRSRRSMSSKVKSCESERSDCSTKRPSSAYIFFYREAYRYASESGCITTIQEFASLCGQKWKCMSARDKQRYEDMACEDRRRYRMERGC